MSISPFNAGLLAVNNAIQRFENTTPVGKAKASPATVAQQSANLTALAQLNSSATQTSRHDPVTVNSPNQLGVAAASGTENTTVQGTVLQAAKAATLTVIGGPDAKLTAGGDYRLSGSLGSTTVSLVTGQSLDDVATTVNKNSSATGVAASVSGNNLVLTSTTVGSQSVVSLQPLGTTGDTVGGLNAQQISSFQIASQTNHGDETLTGTVTSSASSANLVYHGAAGGVVAGTAAFVLTGANGSTNVSLTQGESLSDVASRINQQAQATGVVAVVKGDDLTFASSATGTDAIVKVSAVNPAQILTTNGVNGSQIATVNVSSIGNNSNETLTGQVNQTAGQASLILQGTSQGTIANTATFAVSGVAGSANVSVTQGQSLADAANQVNALTSTTGVVASVVSNNLVFHSTGVGSSANVSVQLQNITHTSVVSGVNSQQLSAFQANSLTTGAAEAINGTVTRSATQAAVTLQGSNQGTVVATATFQLAGTLGTSNVSIVQGQALTDVANQVNALTSTTGVVANVVSNNLVFQSTAVGSAANIGVKLTNISHTTVVTGVNSQQLASFQANSLTSGASETLNATVSHAATQASVTLQGSAQGTVVDTATFKLSGALGAANIAVTKGQSLSDVANQVNGLTSSTGVTASVVSNDLVFNSTGLGSAANVGVALTNITHTTVVSGVNSQQLTSFQTNSISTGASDILAGSVTQAATQATVSLQGSSQGAIVDSATFQLSGALGSTNLSVTQGQSLSSVATQVNALTSTTGVTASVVSNSLVFKSSAVGSAASVGVHLTNITHTTVVSGVNSQQLTSFQANSFTTGASETLAGAVTQAATQAAVTLQGSSQGTVVDTATFQLKGTLGSKSLSITQGQSLSSVATQVNALTSSTGVTASVVSNSLVFKSTTVGSTANVGVQLTNISHTTVVSGVNSQQLTSFQANSFTAGASETISGSVTQSASTAQLSFAGSLGFVGKSTTFTLTGSQGSVQLSTTALESLSTLVTQVDQSTSTTGVQAVLSGNNVLFQSVGLGSNATVSVKSLSGGFSVTGGQTVNGASVAKGNDALATINGHSITGSGNTFQYTDALGSFSLTTAAGFTGALSSVSVNSQAGQFALSGGNGNGSASGTDAVATINGQTVTGTGNSFQYADALGSYSFTTASGFTGLLSSISVNSQAGQFNLTGANANGAANGTDATAVINGKAITGTGNSFNYVDALGSYSFNTAAGFVGALSPINVNSQAGQFTLTGGNGNGTANGTDAVATVNGQSVTAVGNAFTYTDGVGSYAFNTATGFVGAVDAINVNSQAGQFNLAGGNGNGTASGTDALAVINGQAITGNGNSFQYNDASGSYSFSSAAGFVGALNTINVNALAGQFGLSGGNGNGTANGTNAVATINGQTVTGNGNQFQYSDGNGTVQLQFAVGFQGTFDPIAIQSQAANFDLEGGNGQGFAQGTNLVATVNGAQLTSSNNQLTVAGQNGTYQLTFANGFAGQIDPVTINPNPSLTILGGGNNGTSFGSDVIAVVNGSVQTGNGSDVSYTNSGSQVNLDFDPGFEGTFDPVVVGQTNPETSTNISASANLPSDAASATSAAIVAGREAAKLWQSSINQNLVQSQFDLLHGLLNEISGPSRISAPATHSKVSSRQTSSTVSQHAKPATTGHRTSAANSATTVNRKGKASGGRLSFVG